MCRIFGTLDIFSEWFSEVCTRCTSVVGSDGQKLTIKLLTISLTNFLVTELVKLNKIV